jgi:hypothetical protein
MIVALRKPKGLFPCSEILPNGLLCNRYAQNDGLKDALCYTLVSSLPFHDPNLLFRQSTQLVHQPIDLPIRGLDLACQAFPFPNVAIGQTRRSAPTSGLLPLHNFDLIFVQTI